MSDRYGSEQRQDVSRILMDANNQGIRIEPIAAYIEQLESDISLVNRARQSEQDRADKAEATIEANNSFLIKSAASCARMQGGLWSNDEYPFSKDELRTKLNLAAHFISNTGTELRDKALQ